MSMSDQTENSQPRGKGTDVIREGLKVLAAATDSPPPGDGTSLVPVSIIPQIGAMARAVGMVLRGAPIFRLEGSISTVDKDGNIGLMNAVLFVSWVEDYITFTMNDGAAKSISIETASKILAANQFRDQLRELKGVFKVRTPIWTGDGESRTVKLAEEGYDENSGIFTVDSVPYPDDMTEMEGAEHLATVLGEFPYETEGESIILRRRSFAAHLALMIGSYCHALFPEKTARPLGAFIATQPDTGKSLANRLALCAVHGLVSDNDMPDDEKGVQTLLESTALQRDSFLILDNCTHLRSKSLDRFITSPIHNPRLFNKQETRRVANCTQVFVNGNCLTLSPDLERRALVVDFFLPGEASGRKFRNPIRLPMLDDVGFRSKLLAAQWAVVRAWRDKGMPRLEEVRSSFEEWSGLVGGIVVALGAVNPFAPRQLDSGGDEAGRALLLVIGRLVGEASVDSPPTLTTSIILERAETDGLLETIVGFVKEPKKALGWKLKPWKERQCVDTQGRAFEFGRRGVAAGSNYVIRFL